MTAETNGDDWQELATTLHERGRIPPKRAKVVALVLSGHTHRETADILDMKHRSQVSTHVKRYRADRDKARWLIEQGPEL